MKKEKILYWFGVYSMRVYYLVNRDSNSSLKKNIYKPPDITLKFDQNKMITVRCTFSNDFVFFVLKEKKIVMKTGS